MRNIKLTLEYEGTAYLGWQRQPQGPTVQQVVEETLLQITGAQPQVIGAGRTDSGVHAQGQAANFRTESSIPVERLHGALNALLPRDIVVTAAEDAPEDFNARFSARSKLYRYTVWNQRTRPALERRFCWHLRWPIELEAMQEASQHLLGEHDFTAFQSANAQSETTTRTIYSARWEASEPRLFFLIEGNGFLYNMVRTIVGTLIEVGRGKMTCGQFKKVIESRSRALAGRTAPARGLCLVSVKYDYPPIMPA